MDLPIPHNFPIGTHHLYNYELMAAYKEHGHTKENKESLRSWVRRPRGPELIQKHREQPVHAAMFKDDRYNLPMEDGESTLRRHPHESPHPAVRKQLHPLEAAGQADVFKHRAIVSWLWSVRAYWKAQNGNTNPLATLPPELAHLYLKLSGEAPSRAFIPTGDGTSLPPLKFAEGPAPKKDRTRMNERTITLWRWLEEGNGWNRMMARPLT
ncbi:hypothetical protein CONPUDRAFT_165578 [Coniophora puteana RWD-64-598 SS2]|uniref:Uncharacterized protein n=1 Tax=Coniophora puteana (strain RWD-64-598) TaxID=741705 RepID=A0A5M3MQG4_CONPW|nr:uncharacterized protein CONPUDRAFT_165578 [Coniophora puteana RWD-64-598 SS2]EIW81429.1 hypothetical protein CONPUDRAFT_165578 [Coniophora puteana RWD-64-598 SS2]